MTEWQPIETAPRDGTMVLGYEPRATKHKLKFMAFNTTKDGGFWVNAIVSGAIIPTHWMPLPKQPERDK